MIYAKYKDIHAKDWTSMDEIKTDIKNLQKEMHAQ
jgi:hypothetical protein